MNTAKPLHFYLVRGLTREARHWGRMGQLLQDAFIAARISTLDIPGAGEHVQRRSPLTVAQMVEQMRQDFLRCRQGSEHAVLIVISLGGMIGAHWLKHYPADFAQAILINTSFADLSPLHRRLRMPVWGALAEAFVRNRREREGRILRVVTNHSHVYEEGLALWHAIEQDRPVSFSNVLRQLWAASQFRIGNWQPRRPVLLLASTNDRLVSVECSRAIAAHWSVPLLEHPTAGHDLSLDDPEWIVERVRESVTDDVSIQ